MTSRKNLWGLASESWTPTFINFVSVCETFIDIVLVLLVNLNRCVPIGLLPASFRFKYSFLQTCCFRTLDTRHKLNVHKTFRRRLLNVFCSFKLYLECPGQMLFLLFWVPFWFLLFRRWLSSPT